MSLLFCINIVSSRNTKVYNIVCHLHPRKIIMV